MIGGGREGEREREREKERERERKRENLFFRKSVVLFQQEIQIMSVNKLQYGTEPGREESKVRESEVVR